MNVTTRETTDDRAMQTRQRTPRRGRSARRAAPACGALVAVLGLGLAARATASFEPGAAATSAATEDVGARYAELADARDAAGLQALWKEHAAAALPTFDKDLEGGLALWEANQTEPPTDEIRRLFDRALFGAQAAAAALDAPILADYAASFVGWDDVQRRDFRDGQKLVGAAHAALKEGDAGRAVTIATDALWKTQHLGDWWGLAMSHEVRGRALQASQSFEHALAAHAQARQLYGALHMPANELSNLRRMVSLCVLLERWPRADVACADALALAEVAGAEEPLVEELRRARATIDAALAKD